MHRAINFLFFCLHFLSLFIFFFLLFFYFFSFSELFTRLRRHITERRLPSCLWGERRDTLPDEKKLLSRGMIYTTIMKRPHYAFNVSFLLDRICDVVEYNVSIIYSIKITNTAVYNFANENIFAGLFPIFKGKRLEYKTIFFFCFFYYLISFAMFSKLKFKNPLGRKVTLRIISLYWIQELF